MRMHEHVQASPPVVPPTAPPVYMHLHWLPNALTRTRILLSPAIVLCVLMDHSLWAASLFILGGLTDVIDGPFARALDAVSASSARLDSLADAIFFSSALLATALATDLLADPLVLLGIVLVGLLRGSNLLLTRLRFATWDAMHTIGNKLAGLIVFGGMLQVLLLGRAPRSLCLLLISVAFLSAVEETTLIVRSNRYDPNTPGIGGRVLRAVRHAA